MRAEEPGNRQEQPLREDRDSIWTIPLARRALYFGLFTLYALAGIGFLIWYEVFDHTVDTWSETVLSITQGIGVASVGAAGLALLTIEGPENIMVVADYLRKKLIEPLEERRRQEAEQRQREARDRGLAEGRAEGRAAGRAEGRAAGRAEGRAEGEARRQAEWVAWNERRMTAASRGDPFDEPPPEWPAEQDGSGEPPLETPLPNSE